MAFVSVSQPQAVSGMVSGIVPAYKLCSKAEPVHYCHKSLQIRAVVTVSQSEAVSDVIFSVTIRDVFM